MNSIRENTIELSSLFVVMFSTIRLLSFFSISTCIILVGWCQVVLMIVLLVGR